MRQVGLLLACGALVLFGCSDDGGRASDIEQALEGRLFADAVKSIGYPDEVKNPTPVGPVAVWYRTAAKADVVGGVPSGVLRGACKMSAQVRGPVLTGVHVEGDVRACRRFAAQAG
jgi:hypothetical protein